MADSNKPVRVIGAPSPDHSSPITHPFPSITREDMAAARAGPIPPAMSCVWSPPEQSKEHQRLLELVGAFVIWSQKARPILLSKRVPPPELTQAWDYYVERFQNAGRKQVQESKGQGA